MECRSFSPQHPFRYSYGATDRLFFLIQTERTDLACDIPIDILMATYNGAEFLSAQIESLRAQTHGRWRLLVRDDGSSDDTIGLLKAEAEKDTRIQLASDALGNLGFNGNFLHLLRHSTAPYVMFCDQDDVWMPRKAELTLKEMLRLEAQMPLRPALVHCDAIVVDSELRVVRSPFIGAKARRPRLLGMLFTTCVQGAASMINAPLRDRVLSETARLPYDYYCGLVAAAIGERSFIKEPLLLYRQHSRNTIGIESASKRLASGNVSPTLQLAINALMPITEAIRAFEDELSPQTAQEMADFVELVSGRNRLRRLYLAMRRHYAFYRRRDRLNLMLYICDLPNI